MRVRLRASVIQGEITAPPSKSVMQRACAAALLHKGTTHLLNPGNSADDKAALSIIQQLGAEVEFLSDKIIIHSNGIESIQTSANDEIHCGESGLSTRMFTPIAALSPHAITIKGHGSLLNRPMRFFKDVFPILNVKYESNNDFLPIRIQGPMQAISISVDGSQSSQYITGLFMAYATIADTEVFIHIKNAVSHPYIDLTLDVMKAFHMNIPFLEEADKYYFHKPKLETKHTVQYDIEGDWSNASFWLVLAAISGSISIKGLEWNSHQADKSILKALEEAGADYIIENDSIFFSPKKLKAFEFNATHSPDLFPPLAVLASICEGTSRIQGTHRLIHKESNRCESIISEFSKIGITVYEKDDSLYIVGNSKHKGCIVSSHNDHRMAMALAILGVTCQGEMEILEAESVNKSYPDFWKTLQQLGANIEFMEE